MDENSYWPIRHRCYCLIEELEPGVGSRVNRTLDLFGVPYVGLTMELLNRPDVVESFRTLAGPYGRVYYQMLKAREAAKGKD